MNEEAEWLKRAGIARRELRLNSRGALRSRNIPHCLTCPKNRGNTGIIQEKKEMDRPNVHCLLRQEDSHFIWDFWSCCHSPKPTWIQKAPKVWILVSPGCLCFTPVLQRAFEKELFIVTLFHSNIVTKPTWSEELTNRER